MGAPAAGAVAPQDRRTERAARRVGDADCRLDACAGLARPHTPRAPSPHTSHRATNRSLRHPSPSATVTGGSSPIKGVRGVTGSDATDEHGLALAVAERVTRHGDYTRTVAAASTDSSSTTPSAEPRIVSVARSGCGISPTTL